MLGLIAKQIAVAFVVPLGNRVIAAVIGLDLGCKRILAEVLEVTPESITIDDPAQTLQGIVLVFAFDDDQTFTMLGDLDGEVFPWGGVSPFGFAGCLSSRLLTYIIVE